MTESGNPAHPGDDETRRDFLNLLALGLGAVGTAAAVWPLIYSMNPAADVLALGETEVDLGPIEEGQSITVIWRGSPVFIRRRSAAEIAAAGAVDLADLIDPEPDQDRVQKPEWLILVGVCTHLGCVPKGQRPGDNKGDFGGWYCPCHASHYDTSGRIRRGPAPKNLVVPPYQFLDDMKIRIG